MLVMHIKTRDTAMNKPTEITKIKIDSTKLVKKLIKTILIFYWWGCKFSQQIWKSV